MVTIRGFVWGLRNLIVNYRYFENWYVLILTPSIGKLRTYGLKFEFPTITDLAYDSYVLRENFFENQYDFLNVKNKTVLDLGENMGDTAILFAYKGAKKVIGYEPYTYQYQKALKNIKLNKMENKIISIRAAASDKKGRITIKDGYSDGSSKLINVKKGITIPQTTLNDIVKKYKPSILKCDVEGSEYKIFPAATKKTLRSFEQMIIDYHHKGPDGLIEILKKAGFNIEVYKYGEDDSGMIRARRL